MSLNQCLEMRAISLAFSGFPALTQVDFTLRAGSVHALTGANGAGKSTLMAVLSGAWDHYQGQILLDGEPVHIRSPRDAKALGIHLVQQEVDAALVPGLSVAENIMLDSLREGGLRYRWGETRRRARAALAQLVVEMDVTRRIDSCSLAEKQHVLLARALSHHCRYLILDEPTAPLDQHESERLFAVVRRLQAQGMGVVFISHRIHELKAICDTLTVLRDGRLIESGPMASLSGSQIVEKMLGHALDTLYPPRRPTPENAVLLAVDGLHDDTLLQDISLRLRKGEILGIAGLAGAGKTELCKALFGASKSTLRQGERCGVSVAAHRSCGFGGARAGAGAGRATQRGHFYRRADRHESRRQRRRQLYPLGAVWSPRRLALGAGGDFASRHSRQRARAAAAQAFRRQPAESGYRQMAARQ